MINTGYMTAGRSSSDDEHYTPDSVVKTLLPYLKAFERNLYKSPVIWCPFDTKASAFVEVLSEAGYQVIHSHIDEDKDFFTFEPKDSYDIIISNPPFSLKDQVLKRLTALQKPFAMLMPLPTLQGVKRFPYLKDCQALIFDKRVNYFEDIERTILRKGVAFASIFICKNFLPKDLIFEEL